MAGLAVVLALVALATVGNAQVGEPKVAIADGTWEEPIVPLGPAARIPMTATVTCAADELPGTVTDVWTRLRELPPFASGQAASRPRWGTDAGDCPNDLSPRTVDLLFDISLTQAAPAFVPVPIAVQVFLHQNVTTGEERAFGPYDGTLTFTPGYFNLFNVRLEKKIQKVAPEGTAIYPIEIDNMSNGATRFDISVEEAPKDLVVELEPVSIVLEPGATGTMTAEVSVHDPGVSFTNNVGAVALRITSASTDPRGGPGTADTVATLTQFQGGPLDAPGPGVAVIAVLALVGLACARRR